jgi:hypothetical protein
VRVRLIKTLGTRARGIIINIYICVCAGVVIFPYFITFFSFILTLFYYFTFLPKERRKRKKNERKSTECIYINYNVHILYYNLFFRLTVSWVRYLLYKETNMKQRNIEAN